MYSAIRRSARSIVTSIKDRLLEPPVPSLSEPLCNICGFALKPSLGLMPARLEPDCAMCGTSLQARALIAALQSKLDPMGHVRVLERIPLRRTLKGLGVGNDDVCAGVLERKFNYTNLHNGNQALPEIQFPCASHLHQYDFIVAPDALTHADAPSRRVFGNLRAMLKHQGLLVMCGRSGLYQGGFDLGLKSHAHADLVPVLRETGFRDIQFHGIDHPQWGITHQDQRRLPITAKAA